MKVLLFFLLINTFTYSQPKITFDLKEYLDKQFKQLDKRFEQIDKRFEQIDKRFEQMDNRLNRIEGDVKENRSLIINIKDNHFNHLNTMIYLIIGTLIISFFKESIANLFKSKKKIE